ncbi:hypothetical protein NDU88_010603 [Pleurodeles waltl]|uniref:Uncharacterized protein n=1 Tax=Pleurodeles waltl TaxID=8319 RepID=A0AAV7RZH4_PLEWA|nr:hypothetical protein NDU88_010603 [Pleurodeles waltl]
MAHGGSLYGFGLAGTRRDDSRRINGARAPRSWNPVSQSKLRGAAGPVSICGAFASFPCLQFAFHTLLVVV